MNNKFQVDEIFEDFLRDIFSEEQIQMIEELSDDRMVECDSRVSMTNRYREITQFMFHINHLLSEFTHMCKMKGCEAYVFFNVAYEHAFDDLNISLKEFIKLWCISEFMDYKIEIPFYCCEHYNEMARREDNDFNVEPLNFRHRQPGGIITFTDPPWGINYKPVHLIIIDDVIPSPSRDRRGIRAVYSTEDCSNYNNQRVVKLIKDEFVRKLSEINLDKYNDKILKGLGKIFFENYNMEIKLKDLNILIQKAKLHNKLKLLVI